MANWGLNAWCLAKFCSRCFQWVLLMGIMGEEALEDWWDLEYSHYFEATANPVASSNLRCQAKNVPE